MQRSEVLFVGGRSGVGKSTAAEALHDLLVAADVAHAVIEGDLLDLAHPAPHVAHPEVRLAERNLRSMWAGYRELGHHRLVFTNTVSVLEHERLAAAMGDDPLVTAVLLRASDDTTAGRLARRAGGPVPEAQLAHSTATAGSSTRPSRTRSPGWRPTAARRSRSPVGSGRSPAGSPADRRFRARASGNPGPACGRGRPVHRWPDRHHRPAPSGHAGGMNDNRLGTAVSPYLRLHADNPVDWREWGPEAFAEARERDVPVLVSVGYATCHWCHVMARESFSDPEIGALLRRDFVAVKVDREERPDVDASLMASASAFTQQLGWPLTAFATPEGRVFFAGTYYPPTQVGQVGSFRQVLAAVLDAWTQRRHEVDANAGAIAAAIAQGATADAAARGSEVDAAAQGGEPSDGTAPGLPSVDAIRAVTAQLVSAEDTTYGGFGGAPKFPSAPLLEFLGDVAADGDDVARGLLDRGLDAIRTTELTDADGGVFRYATKRDWSVPHYERMLYDNAGLLAVAGPEQARGIADFLRDTLRRPDGAFVAAQDSESTIDGRRVEGDWYRLPLDERGRFDRPPLDDQVLTGWNGLAIRGLALAGARHGDDEMLDLARGAADAVLAAHVRDGHVVVRSSTAHGTSSAPPTIEDVGLLAEGLLELALVTGEVRYAETARSLVDDGLAGRFDTDPVLRAAGTATGEQPQTALRSGTVALAGAATMLAALTGDRSFRDAATRLVADRAQTGTERPLGHADALGVALALQRPSREVVVVAEVDDPMRRTARDARRPGTVVATATPDQARAWADAGFSLFEGRDGSAPAAYVCHDHVCALPARDVTALSDQLG